MNSKYWLFVGTYTSRDHGGEGIYTCSFDSLSGELTQKAVQGGIDDPSFVEFSLDGRFLYAVSEVYSPNGSPEGTVSAYAVDPETADLTLLNVERSHGTCPCHLSLDRKMKRLFVSNYMSGSFAMLSVQGNGSLGPSTDVIQHKAFSAVNPERQEGPHIHSITIAPDNRYAIVADLGNDLLVVCELDLESGSFQPVREVKTAPGQGPRHLDFHPNGCFVFVLNELGNTISSYAYDAETGGLDLMHSISSLPLDFKDDSIAADIHVHPNGRFLYATNRGHDSLVICSVNESTGIIEVLGYQSTLGEHPRNFCIDPTGNYLLVANMETNNIVSFKIDFETGLLSPIERQITVSRPTCLKFLEKSTKTRKNGIYKNNILV